MADLKIRNLQKGFDGTAISYNLLNGQMIRVLGGHSDWVTSVAMFRTNSGTEGSYIL